MAAQPVTVGTKDLDGGAFERLVVLAWLEDSNLCLFAAPRNRSPIGIVGGWVPHEEGLLMELDGRHTDMRVYVWICVLARACVRVSSVHVRA